MLKLMLGPILLCAGYAVGSYYGADAEQFVHKSPSVTYAAVEQALSNIRRTGETYFDGGTPAAYEIRIARTLDQKLVVTILFNGQQGAEADIDFLPRDGGSSTLIATRIHADRSVLRPVLAGTGKARMAYAPDWLLNLTFKPVLQQLAAQIEEGGTAELQAISEGESEAQWESNLSDGQRNELAEWRQYDATRPARDPDAAAQQYMEGGNAGSD